MRWTTLTGHTLKVWQRKRSGYRCSISHQQHLDMLRHLHVNSMQVPDAQSVVHYALGFDTQYPPFFFGTRPCQRAGMLSPLADRARFP